MTVPFFRPSIGDAEIDEVVATLRSGWLTTGPRVQRFEQEFAAAVGARHAIAVCSCTAALHLAVEALGLEPGDAVVVPAMTFAATAEVVRYLGAHPLLVDSDPRTLNLDPEDARRKVALIRSGTAVGPVPGGVPVVGIIQVHVGGHMTSPTVLRRLADDLGLWLVEDAAHSFPAAVREGERWRRCGEGTADVSCFSFYANKTITTGEGGMAVSDRQDLAERMKIMALHGLSRDAWQRYSGGSSWDYRIVAPGYKYNLTDVAAAIGIHQLARAETLRQERERVAASYSEGLADVVEIELPATDTDVIHSWHLYPIRLRLDRLSIGRDRFVELLREAGIGFSVHWRPLHLHPYYEELGWRPADCPVATREWPRLVSLPLFPGMTDGEVVQVVDTIRGLCAQWRG